MPSKQAAAICFARGEGSLRFLLVQTLDGRWSFPKGNVDPGYTPHEAAAQEAWEEAGAQGRINSLPVTTYRYSKAAPDNTRQAEIEVEGFLLEVTGQQPPQETFRQPQWFAPEEAKQALAVKRRPEHARELARVVVWAIAILEK